MRGDDAYAILKKKMQDMQGEKIQESVNRYFDEHPVQAGATAEQVQQIEQNKKDVTSLKEALTSKADKTALVKTDRKLDALWKLNQGISYEFQTDDTEAYQKTVPSGAKVANVKSIGGKTIVWNQLVKELESNSSNGITSTLNNDLSLTISGTPKTDNEWITICVFDNIKNDTLVMNHKYLVRGLAKLSEAKKYGFYLETGMGYLDRTKDKTIFTCNENKEVSFFCVLDNGYEYNFTIKPQFFDLTQMFGSGNEPSTPEEFEAMFPADYYPYNAGELMSAPVNEVVEQGRNLINISDSEFAGILNIKKLHIEKGKYYFTADIKSTSSDSSAAIMFRNNEQEIFATNILIKENAECEININKDCDEIILYAGESFTNSQGESATYKNIMLTSTDGTNYSPYHKTSYPIPQAILNLPGYGWSAGDVRNEANWENKQYIQRVGHHEFSENTVIRLMKNNYTDSHCSFFASAKNAKVNIAVNGIMSKNFVSKYIGGTMNAEGVCCETANYLEYKVLFEKLGCAKDDNDDIVIAAIKKYMLEIGEEANYPLIEPIITDISDIIDSTFQEPLEVEAGGTLTFKNSNGDDYRIPVPNSEEYLISLAEVAK